MENSYARSGVNVDAADAVKKEIARLAKSTAGPSVLAGPGLFGGMFALKGFKDPVLVSSVDGVGTKLKLAVALDRYDSVGIDIVNHSVNDILTTGATPLFFLDYIAMGRLAPDKVLAVVQGLSKACQAVGCALIGGETAEMPGLYAGADFDLVGCIVGGVDRQDIINGQAIAAGDVVLGLASSGLHTNGYSLARRIFGETEEPLRRFYPELDMSVGEALLVPHRCYYHELKPLLPLVKGLAHITGGGFPGNVPRILPDGLAARIDTRAWAVPPLFQLIMRAGGVDRDEMYRVFNMGIGMVVIAGPDKARRIIKELPEAIAIGHIEKQSGPERVILD